MSALTRLQSTTHHATSTAGNAPSPQSAANETLTKVTRPNERNAPLQSFVCYIGPASRTFQRNAMEANTPSSQASCTRPARPTLRRAAQSPLHSPPGCTVSYIHLYYYIAAQLIAISLPKCSCPATNAIHTTLDMLKPCYQILSQLESAHSCTASSVSI